MSRNKMILLLVGGGAALYFLTKPAPAQPKPAPAPPPPDPLVSTGTYAPVPKSTLGAYAQGAQSVYSAVTNCDPTKDITCFGPIAQAGTGFSASIFG